MHEQSPNGPELVTNAWPVWFLRFITHVNLRKMLSCGKHCTKCRLGQFQDSDFADDLEDSKLISGKIWCIFGSHTFVSISLMCKKNNAVSHSSTESEIISLDARGMEFPLLVYGTWLLKRCILLSNNQRSPKIKCRDTYCMTRHQENKNTQIKTPI